MTIAGVILAGGLSRRMGGRDKALLPLADRPMIAHVAARLAPQLAALAINANGDPARFGFLGLPVLPDTVGDTPGPLAGILAGMRWAAEQGFARLATAPSDTPFLPTDLVTRLAEARAPIALASRDGALHPLAALWSTHLADALEQALAAGTRKVTDWAFAHGAVEVSFDQGCADIFANINTPNDLAEAEHRLYDVRQ